MANYDKLETHSVENKVKFSANSWEKFVIDHGARISWEKSYLCPCVAKTGTPDPDCPICGGVGYAFRSGVETQANIINTSRNVKQSLYGMNTTGTSTATTLEEDFMSIRDRLTFKDQDIPVSVLIPITNKTILHGKNLRYLVKKIDFAVISQEDGTQVEIKPSELSVDYDKGMFYPTEEMEGQTISLNMIVAYRLYVIDILKEARYQYDGDARAGDDSREMIKLPRKLLLRREDQYIPAVMNEANDGKFNPDYLTDETGTDVTQHDDIWSAYTQG